MLDEQRPPINSINTSAELRRWYWLKAELVTYCREYRIPYSASKFELLDRIAYFLDTGDIPKTSHKKVTSSFDWKTEILTLDTVITDSYKSTQNVRRFMTEHVGKHFSFNIEFMRWMKTNIGRTLGDAIDYWQRLDGDKRSGDYEAEIPDHNQYNQYLRDFFNENPSLTMTEARICWDFKRALPNEDGRHRYEPTDLQALNV